MTMDFAKAQKAIETGELRTRSSKQAMGLRYNKSLLRPEKYRLAYSYYFSNSNFILRTQVKIGCTLSRAILNI